MSRELQHELLWAAPRLQPAKAAENDISLAVEQAPVPPKVASLAWIELARKSQVKEPQSRGVGRGEGI